MLKSVDGRLITKVPHQQDFKSVLRRLGDTRVEEVRAELNRIVEEQPPGANGRRFIDASVLGSKLSPWRGGLKHLYDVASEVLGDQTEDEIIEERAALHFGLFLWECMMNRDEEWRFYDPNLSPNDPNREITGKRYFEPQAAE